MAVANRLGRRAEYAWKVDQRETSDGWSLHVGKHAHAGIHGEQVNHTHAAHSHFGAFGICGARGIPIPVIFTGAIISVNWS